MSVGAYVLIHCPEGRPAIEVYDRLLNLQQPGSRVVNAGCTYGGIGVVARVELDSLDDLDVLRQTIVEMPEVGSVQSYILIGESS